MHQLTREKTKRKSVKILTGDSLTGVKLTI